MSGRRLMEDTVACDKFSIRSDRAANEETTYEPPQHSPGIVCRSMCLATSRRMGSERVCVRGMASVGANVHCLFSFFDRQSRHRHPLMPVAKEVRQNDVPRIVR